MNNRLDAANDTGTSKIDATLSISMTADNEDVGNNNDYYYLYNQEESSYPGYVRGQRRVWQPPIPRRLHGRTLEAAANSKYDAFSAESSYGSYSGGGGGGCGCCCGHGGGHGGHGGGYGGGGGCCDCGGGDGGLGGSLGLLAAGAAAFFALLQAITMTGRRRRKKRLADDVEIEKEELMLQVIWQGRKHLLANLGKLCVC